MRLSQNAMMTQNARMVKKYQEQSIKTIEDTLKMSVEAHIRKQVQMHNVVKNITQRFSAKIPAEFGQTFSYGKVFYSILENVPVTVEAYIQGEFVKYINNDGECMTCPNEGLDELFLKAQCLSHFSYEYSNNELKILDIKARGIHSTILKYQQPGWMAVRSLQQFMMKPISMQETYLLLESMNSRNNIGPTSSAK